MGGYVGSLTKKLQITSFSKPVKVTKRFPFHNRQQSKGTKFWGWMQLFKKAECTSNQFSYHNFGSKQFCFGMQNFVFYPVYTVVGPGGPNTT